MNHTGHLFFAFASMFLLFAVISSASATELVIANQNDHTVLLVNADTKQVLAKIEVGINGHEVAVSPDGRYAYSPIYGNSGVGKPGTDGSTIAVIDLQEHKLVGNIDLGKGVRPHCAKFGPDGLLYVTAELAQAVYAVDTKTMHIVGATPTSQAESHMLAISPEGIRAYTANVGPGSVSMVDLQKNSVTKVIPVARTVQRISISSDGSFVYTHDQNAPRIAIIDTKKQDVSNWINLPEVVYSSAVTPDDRWLIANSPAGKLFVWDFAESKLAHTFDIPKAVGEIALSPDAKKAYVSCPQAGTIEIIDLMNWKKEDPIVLTKGVDGLVVRPTASKQ